MFSRQTWPCCIQSVVVVSRSAPVLIEEFLRGPRSGLPKKIQPPLSKPPVPQLMHRDFDEFWKTSFHTNQISPCFWQHPSELLLSDFYIAEWWVLWATLETPWFQGTCHLTLHADTRNNTIYHSISGNFPQSDWKFQEENLPILVTVGGFTARTPLHCMQTQARIRYITACSIILPKERLDFFNGGNSKFSSSYRFKGTYPLTSQADTRKNTLYHITACSMILQRNDWIFLTGQSSKFING